MKKISTLIGLIIIVAAVVVLFGGVFAYQYFTAKNETAGLPIQSQQATEGWKTYKSSQYGFEFKYPTILSANGQREGVVLAHTVSYKHPDLCDMKGDAPALSDITDFNVIFKVVDKSLEDAEQANWPGGYFQTFKAGSLKGFTITAGTEGCGIIDYYFPVSASKTLVVARELIPEFNSINSDYQYLNVPGVIRPTQEENIFNQVLSTFKFTN